MIKFFDHKALINNILPNCLLPVSPIVRLTLGVVTLGLLPPIAPGKIDPVSLYRAKIFETHPCDTLNCLLISHGLTPNCANSTILSRIAFGNGLPLTNTPPS